MTAAGRSLDDVVLAAWAPAGWGRIVVVLGQALVVHKFVVSGRAAAGGVTESLTGFDTSHRERDAAAAGELRASPFVAKVMRDGVPGLLTSRRATVLGWDAVVSAQYRPLALNRGRMIVRTAEREWTLKVLQNTVVIGDPIAAFANCLGERFGVLSKP